MRIQRLAGIAAALLVAASGCNQATPPAAASAAPAPASKPGDPRYVVDTEPAGARDVIAARKESTDAEVVTVIGRIGGSTDPWVPKRAAFSIVDRSRKACSDIPGDQCPTPWDYCCDSDGIGEATALVKVVDEAGNVVPTDARELLGVTELQTVVVEGKAQRDEAGNLTVLANRVYVKK